MEAEEYIVLYVNLHGNIIVKENVFSVIQRERKMVDKIGQKCKKGDIILLAQYGQTSDMAVGVYDEQYIGRLPYNRGEITKLRYFNVTGWYNHFTPRRISTQADFVKITDEQFENMDLRDKDIIRQRIQMLRER